MRRIPLAFTVPGVAELEVPEGCTTNIESILINGTVRGRTATRMTAGPDEVPNQWTVYGRNPDGNTIWLADFTNELMALFFASALSETMNVHIEDMVLNFVPLSQAVFVMNKRGNPN